MGIHARLLTFLIALLVLPPFLADLFPGTYLLEGLVLVTLAGSVHATRAATHRQVACAVLAVLALAARVVWNLAGHDLALCVFLAGMASVFLLAGLSVLERMFAPGERVSLETLYGALAVYLVLGFVWTFAYAGLELFEPGSFVVAGRGPLTGGTFDRFVGFSFTTLTTLGYGNIAPATPRADALTVLEAVVGQCYVAVVIARLVAQHLADSARATR